MPIDSTITCKAGHCTKRNLYLTGSLVGVGYEKEMFDLLRNNRLRFYARSRPFL